MANSKQKPTEREAATILANATSLLFVGKLKTPLKNIESELFSREIREAELNAIIEAEKLKIPDPAYWRPQSIQQITKKFAGEHMYAVDFVDYYQLKQHAQTIYDQLAVLAFQDGLKVEKIGEKTSGEIACDTLKKEEGELVEFLCNRGQTPRGVAKVAVEAFVGNLKQKMGLGYQIEI